MIRKSIKDWEEDERPREKLERHGPHTLSLAELLAILINTGNKKDSALDIAKKLLAEADHKISHLARLDLGQIQNVPGIGPAKAVTIAAALEIGRRRQIEKPKETKYIKTSKDAAELVIPILSDKNKEYFYIILLARNNKIIKIQQIGQGGMSSVIVDPKIVFMEALHAGASSLILTHNHPSGNLNVSDADKSLTKKIVDAGKVLDIEVLDHIIVAGSEYISLADGGMMR